MEIPGVEPFPHASLQGKLGGIDGTTVHPKDGEIGIDVDVADIVFFECQRSRFQLHGNLHGMVHEVAVYFIIDVVAVEIVIARVLQALRDDVSLLVEGVGIVYVSSLERESGTVAHDVAIGERIVNGIIYLADIIRLIRIDVVCHQGSFPFLPQFYGMGHLGIEIADVVEMSHHLIGRSFGTDRVIIDRLLAQGFIHPSPKLALLTTFPFVINPCGKVGLESLPIGLQRDKGRQFRFLDFFVVFPFNDYSVLFDQILPFRNEAVDAT